MRKIALAMFIALSPMLSACDRQTDVNYSADDANEDAALNTLEAENNEVKGAGIAVSGMIPDEKGKAPMANVQ